MPIYEHQLRQQLLKNPGSEITSHFHKGYYVLNELKVGSKMADLVFFDKELEEIIAIELKVNKWKSALRQAMTYQLWAKESYIALYRGYINGPLRNREIFDKCGVGLISINGFSKIEVKAKKSLYQKPQYLENARKEINRRLSGDKDQ